jgi:hypothetical protein
MQLFITGVPSAPVVGVLGWKESCTELLLETLRHCEMLYAIGGSQELGGSPAIDFYIA